MNIRHISSSIQQWYSSRNWNDVLATAVVAIVFAALGAMAADYLNVVMLVEEGYVDDYRTLIGSTLIVWPAGVFATLVVAASERLIGRWVNVRGLGRVFAHVAVPIGIGLGLGVVFVLFDPDYGAISWLAEQAGAIAWWTLPLAGASLGLWFRERRVQLPDGTVPVAAIVFLVALLASGAVVGAVVPTEDEVGADVGTEGVHGNPQNASLYVDGETGPHVPYAMSENRTETVPLTDSAFACDESLTVTNYSVGPSSTWVPVESQQRVSDRVSIQRIEFADGSVVPNRLWLTVDVPEDATHVRSVYMSGDDWGEVMRDNYPMNGDHEQYVKTEWGEPGVYVLVFATEDGSLHRYWTPVCASDPVE